jgi:hypothetical protein
MTNSSKLKLVNAYSGFSTLKKLFRLCFFNSMRLRLVFHPSNPLDLFRLCLVVAHE